MTDKDLARLAAAAPGTDDATKHLSRVEWLEAAINIFVDEGIEAVRITRLAEALAVTRGSFYWHFKDRNDLLGGLISFWSEKNTAALLRATEGVASLDDGILALFELAIDPDRFDPRLDQAMRDWARRSADVRAATHDADRARIASLTAFFQRFGYSDTDAYIRARVFYYTQVGYYALNIQETREQRLRYLEEYYTISTGRPLDPAKAAAFRDRHLPA